jgi:GT2 family glycosyltransferase
VATVVVHQPGPWFAETLASLVAQDYPNLQTLFFLTEACSESVATMIREALPNAVVRVVQGNPGFGPTANEVMRLVAGDAGFFCFLHDDVALDGDAVSRLIEETYRSNAGVVGPKLVDWDDPTILQTVGLDADRFGRVDNAVEPGEKDQEQHDAVRDVFVIPSACMLIRADLFREIGGYNPSIAFFGESLDLCWRAHLTGARVLVVPSARVRHRGHIEERLEHRPSRSGIERARVRTVMALSGATRLPVVALQMLVGAVLQVVVGVFGGGMRDALAALRATVAIPADLPGIARRRRAVRDVRRVPPREIHDLQVRGSARLASFVRRRRSRGVRSTGPIDDLDPRHTRVVFLVALALLVFLVVGSRGIITGGAAPIGEFLPMREGTEAPTALLGEYVSGWWQGGFGQFAALPTGVALTAFGGIATFGQIGLLHTVSVIGLLVVAWVGVWAATSRTFGMRSRIVGVVAYAALPIAYDALGDGAWSTLVIYAAAPWVIRAVVRADERPVGARLTKLLAATALMLAVTVAFAAEFTVVAVWIALAWFVGSVLAGGSAVRALLGLRLIVAGVLGALVLNMPWAITFLADDPMTRTFRGDPAFTDAIGFVNLARFDSGETVLGPFGLLLYAAAAVSLLVARGPRAVWAIRSALLVVPALLLVLLADRDVVSVAPSNGALLVIVGLGVALGAVSLAAQVLETTPGGQGRTLRIVGALALTVSMAGVVPAAVSVVDGRWGQPDTTLAQLLAQIPTDPAEGDFAVAYVGRRETLPIEGHRLDDSVFVAVADDGELTMRDRWQPLGGSLLASLDSTFSAIARSETVRGGKLLAPLAVRYVAVVLGNPGDERVRAQAGESPATDADVMRFVDGLSGQLDFRRVYYSSELLIFENTQWIPSLAKLNDPSAVMSTQAGNEVLLTGDVVAEFPIRRTSAVTSEPIFIEEGTIHLAAPHTDRLVLDVGGVAVQSRVAFGGTTAFDSPLAGIARVDFRTPWTHLALVIVQVALWLLAIVAVTDIGRFRRRTLVGAVRLVEDDLDHPALRLDGDR